MKFYNARVEVLLSFFFFLEFFGFPRLLYAATYWVSPSGSASWSGSPNCQSANDPGSNYCSLDTALALADAGDTVYIKGGDYDRGDIQYGVGFAPAHSGTCPNPHCYGGVGAKRIIFSTAPNEIPIIHKTGNAYNMMGIDLSWRNWVRITGLNFKNFTWYTALLDGTSSYNEIDHCSFINDPSYESGAWFSIGGFDANYGATHNYVHDNYFSKRRDGPCGEAIDMIRVGNAEGPPTSIVNYNTVENNYIEYGGHATVFTTGKYLVIKNNISHNEPWIQGCTNYLGNITSTDTQSLATGTKTFHLSPGLNWPDYASPVIFETSNPAHVMQGMTPINGYDPVTGILTINISDVRGSGTYSDWTLSFGNVPYYLNPAYSGMYGHRNFAIGDADNTNNNYVLVEGNRIGFASVNPGNGGSSNLDLESPGNIARYNYIYGGMDPGIYFKWANGTAQTGGVRNHVYNNTVFQNGYGWDFIYGGMNVSYSGRGIAQFNYNSAPTFNVIKNNISYGNRGDICGLGLGTPCTPATYDTVDHNWCTDSSSGCTAYGDPYFANPDISNPLSQNLFSSVHGYAIKPLPDLSLTANSVGLIDGGAYLTTAIGSGSNSRTLIVQDALYFQDGTWGSDLARGVTFFPDWIAIGSVNNAVQIQSINYDSNTITLASPMTWSNNERIWLYRKSDGARVLYGSAPDYGAYEYTQTDDITPPASPTGLAVR